MYLRAPFLLSIIAIIVGLSACSTGNDVISERGIQKRKYRKGFYVAHPTKKKDTEPFALENSVDAPLPCGVADHNRDEENTAHREHLSEYGAREAEFAHPSIPKKTAVYHVAPALEHTESGSPQRSYRPKLQRNAVNTALAVADHGESADDTELLLYIILSILLPPLAVYLLYGISTNFWISIILTILLWLPGVIFALIHVLNRKG